MFRDSGFDIRIKKIGDALASLVVDVQGFEFGQVDRHDHPMFVPGALKYFGVDGLVSLNAPRRTMATGTEALHVTRAAHRAGGSQQQLHEVTAIPDPLALAAWLKHPE